MPFKINSINSPSHLLKIKQTECQAVLEVDQAASNDNSALILIVNIATIHMPRMIIEDYRANEQTDQLSNNEIPTRACMVSFYPEFESLKTSRTCVNLLIDCSNSMTENLKLTQQLSLCILEKLPKSCSVNIILFGSDYIELFPIAQQNLEINFKKAFDFLLRINENMNRGNTDLLNVILPYLQFNSTQTFDYEFDSIQNFILISDGHFTRPNELFTALRTSMNSKENKVQNRIFTCSIGSLSNTHNLKIISRLTAAAYDSFDQSLNWNDKISDLIDKISRTVAIQDLRIEWQNLNNSNENGFNNLQAPKLMKTLFSGRRVVAYGFIPNCHQATLKAKVNGNDLSVVVSCPELCITQGSLIHKLTAKSLIDDWQSGVLSENDQIKNDLDRSRLKHKIIKLSQMFSITSEFTSFLAIEDRADSPSSETPLMNDLLECDKEAKSIDILPYMDFQTFSSRQNSKNIEIDLVKELDNIQIDSLDTNEVTNLVKILEKSCNNVNCPLILRAKYITHLVDLYTSQNKHFKSIDALEQILDTIKLETSDSEHLDDLKDTIESKLEDLSSRFSTSQLFVKTLTGKTLTIDCPMLTICDLKKLEFNSKNCIC